LPRVGGFGRRRVAPCSRTRSSRAAGRRDATMPRSSNLGSLDDGVVRLPRATLRTSPRGQAKHGDDPASGAGSSGRKLVHTPVRLAKSVMRTGLRPCGAPVVPRKADADQQGEPDPRRGTGTNRCPAPSAQLGGIGDSARAAASSRMLPRVLSACSRRRRARVHRVRRGRSSSSPGT
jgi:hypothetical protein